MRNLLWILTILGLTGQVNAQLPTNSFAVTSACPASAGTPSVLHKINTNGTLSAIATVQEDGTPLILNALGYDNNDDPAQRAAYGMNVVQPITLSNFQTPPNLYKLDLNTAAATKLGAITPPTVPPSTFFSIYFSQTLNFVGDGSPSSVYYVGAATFRYNIWTQTVDQPKLYVGTIQLVPFTSATPVWRQLDTSDPITAAIVEDFRDQAEEYISSGGNAPIPEGGIQDWVYDPFSGNLVSYLGQEFKFLTITNPGSNPVATTVSIPVASRIPTPSAQDIGSMFTDKLGNLYVVTANSGSIFRVERTTGAYTGLMYTGAFGCSRGDAVSFANALPLPVTLTNFQASLHTGRVELHWATASEKNTRHFAVQRSQDGNTWQIIATQPAANAANGSRYRASDTPPANGLHYYRLEMMDWDGSKSYSPIETIHFQKPQKWAVWPNPAHEQLNISAPAGSCTFMLRNALGQVVRQFSPPSSNTPYQLSLKGLAPGLYFLSTDESGRTAQKIEVR